MLARVREAWAEVAHDDELLCGVLRDVGHACMSFDDEALREVRNFLATAPVQGQRREGMLTGAVELIDGYREAASARAKESLAELCLGDGLHLTLLRLLVKGNATPTLLAKHAKAHASEVSTALRKLREAGLVDPPSRDRVDGRRLHYRLTPRARALLAPGRSEEVAPSSSRSMVTTSNVPPPVDEPRGVPLKSGPPLFSMNRRPASDPRLGYTFDSSRRNVLTDIQRVVESLYKSCASPV